MEHILEYVIAVCDGPCTVEQLLAIVILQLWFIAIVVMMQ